ncbi:MAG TPA: PfkB family carbohydrate kinase [Ignavibacteriales bacterium]|nr:PfkB family carbohydrate kinase [Ignavibacteriales bacterium]
MILTVTLNPLLERRFYFDNLNGAKTQRASAIHLTAGGKGINVSRQLNKLGMDNIALTFLGGQNGKSFRKIIQDEQIKLAPIQIKSEMREAALIIDKGKRNVFHHIGPNFIIEKEEAEDFKSKMEKMIENCDIAVFSGSSPCASTDDIFPLGIEIANKLDKISILDTYGPHLKTCLRKEPSIIHLNVDEAASSLNKDLSTEEAKTEFLREIYKTNKIRRVFLTDGASPFYSSNFDFIYKCETPAVSEYDPTGSGDAFIAGVAYSLDQSCTFEETLKFSSALGALNASTEEVCAVDLAKAQELIPSIHVQPIGKRMSALNADIY